jgi:hypothetical protein
MCDNAIRAQRDCATFFSAKLAKNDALNERLVD